MSPTRRHTMKLLFVVSLCAFFAATGSVGIMKRQNPAACASSDLINATVGSTSAACQAAALYNFSAHFMGDTQQTDLIRTLCEPSCGKPVLRFFNECLGADVAGLAVQLCAKTSSGQFCYEVISQFSLFTADAPVCNVAENCRSSTQCVTAVRTIDCCISIIKFITGFNPVTLVEQGCGVDLPNEECSGSTLTDGANFLQATAAIIATALVITRSLIA